MRRQFTSAIAVLLLLTAGVAGATPAVAAAGGSVGAAAGGSVGVASGGSIGAATGSSVGAVTDSSVASAQTTCSFPVERTDATGSEVTVDAAPERVVTLGPSATQTMWEIGGKSQVVGVTQYASYLDGADERTNVSGEGRTYVSVEEAVATEADLVLAANIVTNETVERLREAGLTVYRFGAATSVEDIYAKTELTGELTGNCEGATETVDWMRDRVSTVRETVENGDEPRVFVSQGGGWTAGSGTFIGNVVELAGGTNVAAEANISGYGQISEEVIVDRDPEWIVQIGAFGGYPQTEAYNGTHAVQNGQTLTVSSENVSQPAPRVVHAVVAMAEAFHPEAFAEADATDEETSTADAADATETTDATTEATTTDEPTTEAPMQDETTTTEESSGSIPGFGAAGALVALAGAVLLARRR